MSVLYCIVVRSAKGNYYREVSSDKPTIDDIIYFEKYHASTEGQYAVVVNVFEVEA